MAEALISRRGGGSAMIKFENYSSLKRENAPNLSEGRSHLAATANENYALFAGGYEHQLEIMPFLVEECLQLLQL